MDKQPLSLDQTSQGWDSVVQGYEDAAESLTGLYLDQLLSLSGLQAEEQVLDVAAGTGVLALAAAKCGANVLATDFSPSMVERIEGKVADESLSKIKTRVMDGQYLDLPDGRFDITFSNFGIIFFPEPDKGFQEMYRVLKQGGRAAVTACSSPQELEFMQVLIGSIRKVVPDFEPSSPPVWLRFQDPVILRQSMEEAGFRDVHVHTIVKDWPMPTASWFPERVLGIAPPMKVLLGQFSKEQQREILDGMTHIIQDYFSQGKRSLTNEAHIGVGVK
jgi:SAM-dependent methyltransferase